MDELKRIMNEQIDDRYIWLTMAATKREEYLTVQLRKLHAAVESCVFNNKTMVNKLYMSNELDMSPDEVKQ